MTTERVSIGELTDNEREALVDWWESDWPDTKAGAIGTLYEAVERILAARASDGLAERVRALADEWTHAACQTDGAPCSWHRVSAECAEELRVLLDEDPAR